MNTPPLLQVKALQKRFGRRELLADVELELCAGEAVLLCGTNGAGKSTLLRILAGLERPEACRMDLGQGMQTWQQCRKNLFISTLYLHQHPYMFDGSVRYNLGYALPRKLSRNRRNQLLDEAMAWAGLEHLRETPAKNLSGGERQRVSLARAWLRKPRVLLLDEPTANLDQASRERTLELLLPLKQAGLSLLIASHDAHHFAAITERTLHLHEGKLINLEPKKVHAMRSPDLPIPLRTPA